MAGENESEGHPKELTPETRWQQEGLTHEQIVHGFRNFIQEWNQQFSRVINTSEIFRLRLKQEWQTRPFKDEKQNTERSRFFFTLFQAWDALAYDSYTPGSSAEHLAGAELESRYVEENEATVKLSPAHIRVIDALSEAAGIPHQKEQSEIPIPEKLKNYLGYQLSPEYRARVAQARAKPNK